MRSPHWETLVPVMLMMTCAAETRKCILELYTTCPYAQNRWYSSQRISMIFAQQPHTA